MLPLRQNCAGKHQKKLITQPTNHNQFKLTDVEWELWDRINICQHPDLSMEEE